MNKQAMAAQDFAITGQLDIARKLVADGVSEAQFLSAYDWAEDGADRRARAEKILGVIYGDDSRNA